MNLYDIDKSILLLMSEAEALAEQNEGEIPATYIEQLDELKMEQKDKWINVALYIKNIRAESDAIGDEIKRLTERRKIAENKVARMIDYLSSSLTPGTKIEDPKVVLSWRKSESVKLEDGAMFDEKYLRGIKYDWDKKLIKEAIRGGIRVSGATLVGSNNLQIK